MADTVRLAPLKKFADPEVTATGERRARVALAGLRTLWINTGSLCNITCRNCYIELSPENDRLAYITRAEAAAYLDEIEHGQWPVREIGFTGGEPFMNPDIIDMLGDALERGFQVLLLTNAMQPMLRPHIRQGLMRLNARRMAAISSFASASITTRGSCMTPSGPPGPTPRQSKGSTGSRAKALRWRWPGAPAGARASRPRATAMPR